ncbi:3-dehydroquinate synthase [Diaporthe helianthi]|uniref:3-dehydroquinate synthase n=1 Tax=Diaporthe helianthi TaxID=158607 RepID=A0A2P5HV72_DIAHE|nr:3-dehydroquinate synthase [Diaporthe helianthi]
MTPRPIGSTGVVQVIISSLDRIGVHNWVDQHGNSGSELISQLNVRVETARIDGLFDVGDHGKSNTRLSNYFSRGPGLSKRKACVVVSQRLPRVQQDKIDEYFKWCREQGLLEDHHVLRLRIDLPTDKDIDQVFKVVKAAEHLALRRRDLFVAIGDKEALDVVGFAAAIYRRSTPWIQIPTNITGLIQSSSCFNRLAINYHPYQEATKISEGLFSLCHPPIASLCDPSFIADHLNEADMRNGLAELISNAAIQGGLLLHHVETLVGQFATATDEAAASLLVSAAWEVCSSLADSQRGSGSCLVVEAAAASVKEAAGHLGYAESTAIGTSVTCALLFLRARVTAAEFERVLNLFKHAGLPVYDNELNPERLWECMRRFIRERGRGEEAVGVFLGKSLDIDLAVSFGSMDLSAAASAIRKHSNAESIECNQREHAELAPVHELVSQSALSVRYHVASVLDLFRFGNPTLKGYCSRKKVLVVVDAHLGSRVTDMVRSYFSGQADFRLLAMDVSSFGKDTTSTMKVVDCALDFGLSRHDLFVVVGGGTIMDVVGFAAQLYKGGTPYLRIPTTLVGMIDAGVGVKVGVNFGSHKNFIGGYYAPVACLNDATTFLPTLPPREYACGLAEAIKMALIKSRRLFDVIREHQRDLAINEYTGEVISISIRTMLEELQPNLREDSLIRLVDFGHEFGHIIESLAGFAIPHGECVSMGMAISSSLAYLNGRFSNSDLEDTLKCLASLGLPIATNLDVSTIWDKISTDGIEHKDGKLYLAVPEEVGKGGFIDEISDISRTMLEDVMRLLLSWDDPNVRDLDKSNGRRPHAAATDPQSALTRSPPTPPSSSGSSLTATSTAGSDHDPLRAAVIGASGDIGSNLAQYLAEEGIEVTASVRPSSLQLLKRRTSAEMRVLAGHPLDRANLEAMLRDVDVVYNMAAIVSLSTKPEDAAQVIALNGFGQGIITSVMKQMGRERDVTVVYPSSQRVHLLEGDPVVDEWIQHAAEFYHSHEDMLLAQPDYTETLQLLARKLLASRPLPPGHNCYEISKRLGEVLVSGLPRHTLLRISGVYGPGFRRGFVSRAVDPVPGRKEEAEIRDFIYADDLNELLLKAYTFTGVYDAASGENVSLEEVWRLADEEARARTDGRAHPVQVFDGVPREPIQLDVAFARKLLGRDFVPFREGFKRTARAGTSGSHRDCKSSPILCSGCGQGHPEAGVNEHSPRGRPAIILDIGSTNMRTAIVTQQGLTDVSRVPSPSKHTLPDCSLAELQDRLVNTIVQVAEDMVGSHPELDLRDLGISFGAVVSDGVVQDASVFWGEAAKGYNLEQALSERLPGLFVLVVNDISAAAWRYKDEGRFCLITVSSGLSNKVFNRQLNTPDRLDVGAHGTGGEMGHVLVEPRAVDNMVRMAISQAMMYPDEFAQSVLTTLTGGNPHKIDARHLATAAQRGDEFSLRIADEANVPLCPCGNLADLCSYSSGRGALRQARRLASRYGVDEADVTDEWLHRGVTSRHPLAVRVLGEVVYPLALRILQLSADLGLDKFILTGGFVTKTAKDAYLPALLQQIRRFLGNTGYFRGHTDADLTSLVRVGASDDNDGLVGMGNLMQHIQGQYLAVEKPIGARSLAVVSRPLPRCGALEILAKVIFAGICSTDLQILRGERGLEPTVLGHEGVCQVVEVGAHVQGLVPGDTFVLLPNNPLDDHDKIGHNREGLFQKYIKFGQEFIDRHQVLPLSTSAPTATHTLIEPLSCVLAAQECVKSRAQGKNILIVGAGPLGQLFAIVNTDIAANVFLANRSRGRLDSAIAQGIVKPEHAFVTGDTAAQIQQVSQGEGIDIVIVCVSLGEAETVAQQALDYVNPGGCVYLFGGFRSSDVLEAGQSRVPVWPVRTGWKTERVWVKEKPVEIAGHRGSREAHVLEAAKMIEEHSLSFGRIVSHTISLREVPQTMERMGSDLGRVVIDMTRSIKSGSSAGSDLVCDHRPEPIAELPRRYFEAQAKLPPGQVDRIALDSGKPVLGFVNAPSWDKISRVVEPAIRTSALRAKEHYIWVGTGAWGFMADLVINLAPSKSYHVLQTLDPAALSALLPSIRLETTVCIGISQSGTTIETVMLMDTLRELFDGAGLDYRNHFVWMTDTYQHVLDTECGEEVLRSSGKHTWVDADFIPVNVPGHSAINALFSVPHSIPMFLSLAISLGMEGTRCIYEDYVRSRHHVSRTVLPTASSVALNNTGRLSVHVDAAIRTPALENLIIQLVEQALGAKTEGFNPQVDVVSAQAGDKAIIAVNPAETVVSKSPGADGLSDEPSLGETVPMGRSTPHLSITKAMLTMNALSVFVSAIGYHKRINFVSHPRVAFYKERALSLFKIPSFVFSGIRVASLDAIADIVGQSSQQTGPAQFLRYGLLDQGQLHEIASVCVDGETWNHSRYQAAQPGSVRVILVPDRKGTAIHGISDATLEANLCMLRAIARATHETLPGSLIFRVEKGLN